MKYGHSSKVWLTAFLSFVFVSLFAQARYNAEALIYLLGKDAQSQELKDLKTSYECQMANETHYLSKYGLELQLKDGMLAEIHLYQNSSVYGNFTGKLPKDLAFGMSSIHVKQLLGKPVVSYSSGYCEFRMSTYTIACWFEGDKLSEVNLTIE